MKTSVCRAILVIVLCVAVASAIPATSQDLPPSSDPLTEPLPAPTDTGKPHESSPPFSSAAPVQDPPRSQPPTRSDPVTSASRPTATSAALSEPIASETTRTSPLSTSSPAPVSPPAPSENSASVIQSSSASPIQPFPSSETSVPSTSTDSAPVTTTPVSSAFTSSSSSTSTPSDTSASSSSTSSAATEASPSSDAASTATPTSSTSSHLSTSSAIASFTSSGPTSSTTAPVSVPTVGPRERQIYLEQHNFVRLSHGAPPLSWSDDLHNKAQQYAERCELRHSDGQLGPVGENLAAAIGLFDTSAAVRLFVQDQDQYNPGQVVFSHFTQVVWRSTTQLGCGVAACNGLFPGRGVSATYHVCLYDPVGNVVGQEKENLPL
ncbi:CAP domain-containing protein [Trametes elegans]|nr:CAP domain-containing protein [Trametes elegans]